MGEVTENIKKKMKTTNVFGWIISGIIVCIFILTLVIAFRGCSRDGVKTYDIERIIDKGNGVYTVVIEDDVQYRFSIDDIKIGETNEVCVDTAGMDEVKYVSITSKMAKTLGLDIKEQDGVIIVKDLPETVEETQTEKKKDSSTRNL